MKILGARGDGLRCNCRTLSEPRPDGLSIWVGASSCFAPGRAAARGHRRCRGRKKVTPTEVVTDAAPTYPRVLRVGPAADIRPGWPGRSRSRSHGPRDSENTRCLPSCGRLDGAPTATHARVTHRPHRLSHHRRTRLRSEPAPRPLRNRHRNSPAPTDRRRVH